jgi:hypothetical protein
MYVCNSLCLVVYPRQAAYPQHVPPPPGLHPFASPPPLHSILASASGVGGRRVRQGPH